MMESSSHKTKRGLQPHFDSEKRCRSHLSKRADFFSDKSTALDKQSEIETINS